MGQKSGVAGKRDRSVTQGIDKKVVGNGKGEATGTQEGAKQKIRNVTNGQG